jgi:hypothetical protein
MLLASGCGRGAENSSTSDSNAAVASTTNAPATKDCGVTPATVLTGEGIGELRISRALSEVVARCRVVRDTVELRAEGLPARILTIDLGRDTIEAEVDAEKVFRLTLETPRFLTLDSLGVDAPLSRV